MPLALGGVGSNGRLVSVVLVAAAVSLRLITARVGGASIQTDNIYYLTQFGAILVIGTTNIQWVGCPGGNGNGVDIKLLVFIGGAQLLISSRTEFQLLCNHFVVDKIITLWLIISP